MNIVTSNKKVNKAAHLAVLIIYIFSFSSCKQTKLNDLSFKLNIGNCNNEINDLSVSKYGVMNQALLASRFNTLNELANAIDIQYGSKNGNYVQLVHCSKGASVTSILDSGIHEGDFRNARDGGFIDRLSLLWHSPYAVIHRSELQIISAMARRKPELYGEGDVAFYDLAESCVEHIYKDDLARLGYSDTTEKGYINTFNHITAQALVTSLMSEQMADYIADAHERFHMPELLSGNFSPDQLIDKDKNPTDNYVDIINNEWGQEIGKVLKKKYAIHPETVWTKTLLTGYLNDLQSYYSWSFQIGFNPFKETDDVIDRFTKKLNHVVHQTPLN